MRDQIDSQSNFMHDWLQRQDSQITWFYKMQAYKLSLLKQKQEKLAIVIVVQYSSILPLSSYAKPNEQNLNPQQEEKVEKKLNKHQNQLDQNQGPEKNQDQLIKQKKNKGKIIKKNKEADKKKQKKHDQANFPPLCKRSIIMYLTIQFKEKYEEILNSDKNLSLQLKKVGTVQNIKYLFRCPQLKTVFDKMFQTKFIEREIEHGRTAQKNKRNYLKALNKYQEAYNYRNHTGLNQYTSNTYRQDQNILPNYSIDDILFD